MSAGGAHKLSFHSQRSLACLRRANACRSVSSPKRALTAPSGGAWASRRSDGARSIHSTSCAPSLCGHATHLASILLRVLHSVRPTSRS